MSAPHASRPEAGGAPRGFLLDLNRCTGCHACELACSTENDLGWGRSWRQVLVFNGERRPGLPSFHLSLACNHCQEAPCVAQCPALAIGREDGTGTVQIRADRCIGCRYCSWVCPFDAPRFDAEAGVMGKCTLCSHRLSGDRLPACVEGCPTSALRYGALSGEEEVPGFPPSEARPAIRFTPLLRGMRPPESTWEPDPQVVASFAAARARAGRNLSLRSEWPLLVFSLLAAALSGWILAAALGDGPGSSLPVFAAGASVALGTSTLHLGRKARGWRAVLNLRRSWLSREVAAFGAFVALSAAWLGTARPGPAPGGPGMAAGAASWLGGAAALAGLAFLFCIDRVYDPVRSGGRVHSADSLPTGLLVAAVLLGQTTAALALVSVKLLLCARRLWRHPAPEEDAPGGASGAGAVIDLLRLGVGVATLASLAVPGSSSSAAVVLILVGAGEVIDRTRFYQALRIRSPEAQLARASEELSGRRQRDTAAA